ncbi:MAG TPA: GatB/YqeY domain-containing protein [Longimicrobiales bacterium]|nr:GatB/YqeY domain-containing protein [Longimicrobiales bacterium]
MSKLKQQIQSDLAEARKARDRTRTQCLSMTLSEIRNREIDVRKELDDEGVREVVTKAVKQRRDAATQMREGGRDDLAEKEETEVAILEAYLPEQLDDDEVRSIIREIIEGGADQIGPLMGRLMPRIRGRFDGKRAQQLVREALTS